MNYLRGEMIQPVDKKFQWTQDAKNKLRKSHFLTAGCKQLQVTSRHGLMLNGAQHAQYYYYVGRTVRFTTQLLKQK